MANYEPVTALVKAPVIRSSTPLSRFIEALRVRFDHPEQRIMGGAATRTSFPIEKVIMSGLWSVTTAIAKKNGTAVQTKYQAIYEFAPTCSHLINTGLEIVYDSSEQAASAFDQEVVQLVFKALELGYRPGMELDLKLENKAWQALAQGQDQPMLHLVEQAKAPAAGSLQRLWLFPVRRWFLYLVRQAYHAKLGIAID